MNVENIRLHPVKPRPEHAPPRRPAREAHRHKNNATDPAANKTVISQESQPKVNQVFFFLARIPDHVIHDIPRPTVQVSRCVA